MVVAIPFFYPKRPIRNNMTKMIVAISLFIALGITYTLSSSMWL